MADEIENNTDVMIFDGGAVKALDTNGKVGGYLVRFSGPKDPDITKMRDYFTKKTDFDLTNGKQTTIYYDHGCDPVLKKRKLGTGTMKLDEVGVWLEAQLELRDEYEKAVFDLVNKKKLGWSSGAVSHLVERKRSSNGTHEITNWPIAEGSLTPTPAEPRAAAVSLKSYQADETDDASKGLFAEALAKKTPRLYELCDVLQSVVAQLEMVAYSTNGTGVEVDLGAQVDVALEEFQAAARASARRTLKLDLNGDASKSIDGLTENRATLSLSLPLALHSKAVRDAAVGLNERLTSLHAQRQREGKNRTLNDTHTESLTAIAGELEQAAKLVRGLSLDVSAHETMRRARVKFNRETARSLGVR